MPGLQWGRLQVEVRCQLRRGAWYRVVSVDPFAATVDVNRQPCVVPRYAIEVVSTPPRAWTVVPRANGVRYAVCPNCRERELLVKQPRSLRCGRCHGEFPVDWNETYLGT